MVTPARIQSRALVTCAPLLLDRNWKLGYSARASGVALCGAVVSLYSNVPVETKRCVVRVFVCVTQARCFALCAGKIWGRG